jgi:hypothetical protein
VEQIEEILHLWKTWNESRFHVHQLFLANSLPSIIPMPPHKEIREQLIAQQELDAQNQGIRLS